MNKHSSFIIFIFGQQLPRPNEQVVPMILAGLLQRDSRSMRNFIDQLFRQSLQHLINVTTAIQLGF